MTSSGRVPAGYVQVRSSQATALARPEAKLWVETALRDHGTLYDAAGPATDMDGAVGRAQVRVVPAVGDGRWVIRHYRRGGLLGPLWGDRYVRAGTPRAFAELEASRRLQEQDIRTPSVVAAAVYPVGMFYRGDLVTEWVAGSTLIDALRTTSEQEDLGGLIGRVHALITALACAGAYHVDFNARNVLVADDGRLWVLDLDRMRFGVLASRAKRAMGERLLRSLTKLGLEPDILGKVGTVVNE